MDVQLGENPNKGPSKLLHARSKIKRKTDKSTQSKTPFVLLQ